MIPLFETLFAQRLAWTLLHFLWQGALLGAAAWTAFALTRRRRPQVRYLLGCAFLLACLGSSAATFLLLKPRPLPPLQLTVSAPTAPLIPLSPDPAAVVPPAMSAEPSLPWQIRMQPYLPWVAAAWALGVLLLSLRTAGGWLWLRGLKASATLITEPAWLQDLMRRTGLRRAVRFLESARVGTPMCLGLIRPVVLLPLGFFGNLDPLAAEAVLAHELAHLRRLDGLVNGLQCVIEILLFFHPAVWWISRRIRTEREHCCDDAAVLACGDAVYYAETLSRLDELRDRPPALALQARGGNLMERLRRLLLADPPQLRFATPSLLLVAAIALISSLPAQAERIESVLPRTEESVPHLLPAAAAKEVEAGPTADRLSAPMAGLLALPAQTGPADILPAAPESVMTPSPTPERAEPGSTSAQPPVKEVFYPAPTPARPASIAIPVVDAKRLPILPGTAVRTVQVPPCPVLIQDELLTWPEKGYAVQVPGHSLAKATLQSGSGVAYFAVRAINKWGAPFKGSRHGLGTPEAAVLNSSDTPMTVYFVVSTRPGYPGDGKIEMVLTTAPWDPAAAPSPEPQLLPPAPAKPLEVPAGLDRSSQPTLEEIRPLIQAVVDKTAWGATATILNLKVRGKERWSRAFTDQWPRSAEKVRTIQPIGPDIEGWLIDFEAVSRDPQNAARTIRQTFTLLLDTDRVVHWRLKYPWTRPNESLPEVSRPRYFEPKNPPSPPPPPPHRP